MVDNAIIIAAGTSSRFVPLSYEKHKALTVVRGEVLIERMIRQLHSAGISDVHIVVGFKAGQFDYLAGEYGVTLIPNGEYRERNNNSSIWAAREVLGNSLIIASDLYFTRNPFDRDAGESYYAAEYEAGSTGEWCLSEGPDGYIDGVTIGGGHSWYMADHAFWSGEFSRKFLDILGREYAAPATAGKLWETIYAEHLDMLKMRIRKYKPGTVFEFDSLDALRGFDSSYVDDSRSAILRGIAGDLGVPESALTGFKPIIGSDLEASGFTFLCRGREYGYDYQEGRVF